MKDKPFATVSNEAYGMFEIRRIGIVKRASAWLLDAILLAVLATGFMFLVSLMCNFNGAQKRASDYYAQWEDFRKEEIASVAEFYGFTYTEAEDGDGYTITAEDGSPATLNDVVEKLDESEGKDPETAAAYEIYKNDLPSAQVVNRQYQYVYTMLFMMVSVGLLLSFFCLEFIVPLIFKNGQTVGKKVFSICLVRPNCVRITPLALFARMLFGKFAVETMFPILLAFLFFFGGGGLITLILFVAIILLNVILFFATKNRTPIHDILAYTVAADMKLQMIFQSDEELNEKKASQKKEFIEQEKNV